MSTVGTRDSRSGADRRRYVRMPIRLEALISLQGRQPKSCVARDFCVAGIFVALGPEHLNSVTPQTPATLYFSLVVDGQRRDCQLDLVVYRIVGNGLGCGFKSPDSDVIALLESLAKASGADIPDTTDELRKTQSGFIRKFAEIKDPLADLCDEKISLLVQEFIRAADEGLFIAARDAGNNADETRFLDGQTEMRKRKVEFEQTVPELVRKGVGILNSPLQIQSNSSDSALPELSLVDKDDFEEFLTVSELVSELEPKFKEALFELEKRFSVLANRDIDEHNNPIGPEVLCNVFAEVLKNLESDRMAINKVYRALRNVLADGLGRFYDSVNQFLIQHDILPVVEREKPGFKKSPETKRPSRETPEPDLSATQAPVDFSQTQTGQFAAPPGANRAAGATGSFPAAGGAAAAGGAPAAAGTPANPGSGANPPAAAGSANYSPAAAGSGAYPPAGAGSGAYPAAALGHGGSAGAAAPVADGAAVGGAPVHGSPPVGGGGPPSSISSVPSGEVTGAHPAISTALYGGGDVTFGGFVGGPAYYAAPSMQQAFSTAQTQLALRRQVAPPAVAGVAAGSAPQPAYAPQQVLSGLSAVQQSMNDTVPPGPLDVETIKQRIVESIQASGGGSGEIGQTESDAIEVIANLFKAYLTIRFYLGPRKITSVDCRHRCTKSH